MAHFRLTAPALMNHAPVLAILLCLLGIAPAQAERIWHVATTGSPRGNGSAQHPFPSIQQAIDQAQPGDRIQVGPGTFHESLHIRRSGQSGAPIRLTGARGETGQPLTRLSRGRSIDPQSWQPAPDIGPNVFENSSFHVPPAILTLDGRAVAHVHASRTDRQDGTSGFIASLDEHCSSPAGTSHRGLTMLCWPEGQTERVQYAPVDVPFWPTLQALYTHHPTRGTTLLRLADGRDPRTYQTGYSEGGAVVTFDEAGFFEFKNFEITEGDVGILITGEAAQHILIENCHVSLGRQRIALSGGAGQITVRGCRLTMNPFFDVQPGAWSGTDSLTAAQKQYIYLFYKHVHGVHDTSDDVGITLSRASDVLIENTTLIGGLIGISLGQSRNIVIRQNTLAHFSSVGITLRTGARGIQIHDNRIHDCNIGVRLHTLNRGDGHEAILYRNHVSQPQAAGTHLFCHTSRGHQPFTPPQLWVYHNTFIGGDLAFNLPHPDMMPEGVPGLHMINNLILPDHRAYGSYAVNPRLMDNPQAVGTFDHNHVGGVYPRGVPAWFGPNNLLAEHAYPDPDLDRTHYQLPANHPAVGSGLDLSHPFWIGDRRWDPLPGMIPAADTPEPVTPGALPPIGH